ATTSFAATGARTVAVRLTDDLGIVQQVTRGVTVTDPSSTPGDLSIQPEASTLVVGEPVTFSVRSSTGSVPAFASVEWDFGYDWDTFHADATGTDPSASATFDDLGPRTVAARLTDAGGNTQVLTFDITVDDAPPPAPQDQLWVETDTAIVTG